jgi:hypothetical protein
LALPADRSRYPSLGASDDPQCKVPTSIITVSTSQTPPRGAEAATAGALLVAAIVVCAAVGYGLGALVGLAAPLGLAGLLAGVVVGVALVHARFRRI